MSPMPTPPPPTQPTKFCRQCLYPLDGLAENRCPECGGAFDSENPSTYLKRAVFPDPWEGDVSLVSGAVLVACLPCALDSWNNLEVWVPIVLFAFAIGFGISGVRRKGKYRRGRAWAGLALALPWVAIYSLRVHGQIVHNWPNIVYFWRDFFRHII